MPERVLRLPWPIVVVLAGVVLRLGILAVSVAHQAGYGDIQRDFAIVSGGVPYRDQAVEYPPVTVGLLELVHAIAHSRHAFGVGLVLTLGAIEACLCMLMWRAFGRVAGLAFLVLDTPLYYLAVTRVDVLSVALAALSLALILGREPVGAGVAWAAAVGAKLWPLPLGALLISAVPRRSLWRAVAGAAATAAVVAGGWLAVDGIDGVRQVLTLRGAQGWQIESLAGSVIHVVGAGPDFFQQGSERIGRVPTGLGVALIGLGGLAATAVCIQAGRRGLFGTGWVTAVMFLLATSILLSPQFMIWAVPGAALAVREKRLALVAAFTVVVLLTLLETRAYTSIIRGDALGQALLLTRNAAIVATLLIGLRSLAQGPRANTA
jgi:hypothetical protein